VLHELKREKAPTLIFLHGFLGNISDWNEVVKELPFTCLALNLPGHGNEPFTPNFCEYLLQETKHNFPLNLIGYSMGGRLALQFAALYPEKINSLMLISSHLGLKSGQQNRLAKDRTLAQKLLSLPIDEFLTIWYDQPIFKTLVAKMDIRSMRKNQNPENLARALEAYSLGRQPDLSHIPSRLIVGELDHEYRAHYHPYPHTIIPNAGHAVHLENPQALAGALHDCFR
jgi:2-succinyl-6-hydroxy-2,4-cyclohexadiene-1-carboxylate synthase